MRVRRQKNHRRVLRFFRMAFGVQDPYHVLVDGTFISTALEHKIHIKEQLPKLLGGRSTTMVTGCVLAELRKLGSRALGAAIIAKGYYRVKCGHDDKPISASACCLEQIGKRNERKFLVATQDQELAKALRQVPGVPVIRLNGQVPHIEEPSAASRGQGAAEAWEALQPAAWEKPKLTELQEKEKKEKVLAEFPKKRKGPRGANPLSCQSATSKKKVKAARAKVVAAEAAAAEAAAAREGKKKRVRSRGGRSEADGSASGPTAEGRAAAVGHESEEPARSRQKRQRKR